MKQASGSQKLTAVATALFVMVALGACETVRTGEKWSRGTSGMSKMEVRWLESQMSAKRQAKALKEGDEDADFDLLNHEQNIIGEKKGNPFGSKVVKNKSFRTKDFAGADEYKYGEYQFLKRQNFNAKTARDQDQYFAEGDTESNLLKKRYPWQRKEARTKAFRESDMRARTGDYYRTRDGASDGRPNIVKDFAEEDGASMTVDDVRSILGKELSN